MTALHKVLLHLSVASGLFSATPAVAGPQRPQVWVLLRNDARADPKLVDSAEAELARLYALIDVDLVWVTEIPTPEKRLHVICLVNGEPAGRSLPETALGYTPAGHGQRGVLAYVFLRRNRASIPKIQSANRLRPCRVDWPRARSHASA